MSGKAGFGMNGKAGFGMSGNRAGTNCKKNSPTGKLVRAYRQSYQIQYSALKKDCQYLFGQFPISRKIA